MRAIKNFFMLIMAILLIFAADLFLSSDDYPED